MTAPGARTDSALEVVGLLPFGGHARRISPLPCSKELLPVGFQDLPGLDGPRPKPVCLYLLEKLRRAGISKTYIVLRSGKWDVPGYLGDGSSLGLELAYLMMGPPWGAPYTLDQAYPFVRDARVAFGFPDLVFDPDDAFVRLLARQNATGADVVLGLYAAYDPPKMDMVEVDPDGRVVRLEIKPPGSELTDTWILAVWTPAFTRFLHDDLAARSDDERTSGRELHVGHVLQRAVDRGLAVNSVRFAGARFLDVGSPEDLIEATRRSLADRSSPDDGR